MKIEDKLPDIYFPKFPISVSDPDIQFSAKGDYIIIEWIKENKNAAIPIDKWEDFVEYAIDVNTAKEKYEELQKAYAIQE